MGDIAVGATPTYGRRFGTTEIAKVYVGDELIWPPVQDVALVGSVVYSNASTGAFPTHVAGDLLVVVAVAAGATAPTLPAGFTAAYTSPSTEFSMAVRVGYKFATAAGTTNPTWTGANWITTYVFRGADSTTPFGAMASKNTASNTLGTAPSVTPVAKYGSSTVVYNLTNNGSAGSFGPAPVGWIGANRNARVASGRRVDSRTVNAVTETLAGGGSVNWRGLTFEVLPASGMQVIGATIASGATVAIPPHQPGDLVIIAAQIQNTTAAFAPATPVHTVGSTVPEWVDIYTTNVSSVQGATTLSAKMAYAVATDSNHTSGTWTNATFTTAIVVRGASGIGDVAGALQSAVPVGTLTGQAISPQDRSGKSMVFDYFCSSSTASTNCFAADPPAGWVSRIRSTKTAIDSRFDGTGAGAVENIAVGGLNWRTVSFEVKAL